MNYTINAVNLLLINLIEEMKRFHRNVPMNTFDHIPAIKSYLGWIRERDKDLKTLESKIIEDNSKDLSIENFVGGLNDVITNIIMIQGPVFSLKRLVERDYCADTKLYTKINNYLETLDFVQEEIDKWCKYHKDIQKN